MQISIDVMMNYMIGVQKLGEVCVYERLQKQEWVLKKKFVIDSKNQVIGIGIVQSEKVVFFTKNGVYTWIYRNDKISKFKSYLESIA